MALIQNKTASRQPTRPVPIALLLWLSCGTIGSVLFTITYLIEGVTHPDYSAWQQAISALSLGPGGWVQQINFVVFGVIVVFTAFAWRKFLKGGVGATWYPIVRGLEGLGLIMDGFFSQDPAPGYPKGAVLTAPTLHAVIHQVFAFASITAIAVGLFILAWRFAREPRWRGWATYSVITGFLTIVLIATFVGCFVGIVIDHQDSAASVDRHESGTIQCIPNVDIRPLRYIIHLVATIALPECKICACLQR